MGTTFMRAGGLGIPVQCGMGSSDCRRAVAERWSKIQYRSKQDEPETLENSGSSASTDIEEFADERPLKKVKREVVDLTSLSDSEVEEPSGRVQPLRSAFKLVKSDVFDPTTVDSNHFISFDQIFGDRSLKKSILFSFQYEMDFLLPQFHRNVAEIIIVAQSGTIRTCSTPAGLSSAQKLQIISFNMPPFTCHHSKMIINIYEDDSCRIFLPSNNLTYAEANYPQQVCWCSPRLKRAERGYEPGKSAFQDRLLDYLHTYRQDGILRKVVPQVKLIDFSTLRDVTFIFSAPGKEVESGFQMLAGELSGTVTDSDASTHHYICQSSTVGASLSKKTHSNLFTHVFVPILHGITPLKSKLLTTETLLKEYKTRNIDLQLIYPTAEEIRTSPTGWLCSGWFHFNYTKDMAHYDMLSKQFELFRKQDPARVSPNRKATPSHSKFYMKLTKRLGSTPQSLEKLDWCVYTSSNLSQTAWGTGTAKPRNYEVGILLKSGDRDLLCGSFTDVAYRKSVVGQSNPDSQVVLVPFTIQTVPYDVRRGDEAFCMSKNYTRDINGMPYPHSSCN